MPDTSAPDWPTIRPLGVDGFIVTFADRLDEAANRAALAFRAALDRAGWDGVDETSSTLVSACLRFDPAVTDHATLQARLAALRDSRDWYGAPLPGGRRCWQVPAVFDAALAPDLAEAAAQAGTTPDGAVAQLCAQPLRVQAIGFAPGQPYLGRLPAAWDLPRRTAMTPRVPAGAVAVAIRQLVLFPVATPTGWHHVGQTALPLFRPDAPDPFLLRPGDAVQLTPVAPDALDHLRDAPDGGARVLG